MTKTKKLIFGGVIALIFALAMVVALTGLGVQNTEQTAYATGGEPNRAVKLSEITIGGVTPNVTPGVTFANGVLTIDSNCTVGLTDNPALLINVNITNGDKADLKVVISGERRYIEVANEHGNLTIECNAIAHAQEIYAAENLTLNGEGMFDIHPSSDGYFLASSVTRYSVVYAGEKLSIEGNVFVQGNTNSANNVKSVLCAKSIEINTTSTVEPFAALNTNGWYCAPIVFHSCGNANDLAGRLVIKQGALCLGKYYNTEDTQYNDKCGFVGYSNAAESNHQTGNIYSSSYFDTNNKAFTGYEIAESNSKLVVKTRSVVFEQNGGTGGGVASLGNLPVGKEVTLPECTYTAPEGKHFAGWALESKTATPLKQPGDTFVIEDNGYDYISENYFANYYKVYAIWEDDAPVPTFTLAPQDGTVYVGQTYTVNWAIDDTQTFWSIWPVDELGNTTGVATRSGTTETTATLPAKDTAMSQRYQLRVSYVDGQNYISEFFTVTWQEAPEANALTGTVAISGTLKYGETLTASVTETNSTGTLGYQWQRNGENIESATNSTYTLTAEDVGKTIKVVVTSSVETGSIYYQTTANIDKADGSVAPTGINAIACTTADNNDGSITGVTTAMEYSADLVNWTDVAGTTITGLNNGTYYVRVKETATHKSSAPAPVTVNAYAPTTYTVTYKPNNEADGVVRNDIPADAYSLEDNHFVAPAGKQFKAWNVNGTEKQPGDTITISENTVIVAVWEDVEVETTYTVTYKPNNETAGVVRNDIPAGAYNLEDNHFAAPTGKQFKAWNVNGTEKQPGDTITISENTTVIAVWEDIPAEEPEYHYEVVDGVNVYDDTLTAGTPKDVSGLFEEAKARNGKVELTAGTLTLTFDADAVNAIGGNNVSLTANVVTENLTIDGAQLVVEVSLSGATFATGKATISVPFNTALPEGKVAKVYYVNGNDKTDMNAVFADGKVTFETTHFSTFAVVFEDEQAAPVDPVNPDPVNPEPSEPEVNPTPEKKGLSAGAIAGIVIAIVVVLAGAGVGVFFLLKKKGVIGGKKTDEPKKEDQPKDESNE